MSGVIAEVEIPQRAVALEGNGTGAGPGLLRRVFGRQVLYPVSDDILIHVWSGLKDDLKSLFTDNDVGNEELRKPAEGLEELDVNELSRECRELAALLKGRVAQN